MFGGKADVNRIVKVYASSSAHDIEEWRSADENDSDSDSEMKSAMKTRIGKKGHASVKLN